MKNSACPRHFSRTVWLTEVFPHDAYEKENPGAGGREPAPGGVGRYEVMRLTGRPSFARNCFLDRGPRRMPEASADRDS